MTTRTLTVFCVGMLMACSALVLSAQTDKKEIAAAAGDKYVISAKAGGVNYVEGTVTVMRKGGSGGHLIRRDEIEIGDRVSTGPDGRAEILLNPGSYLRIGPNTTFEFKATSLDDLHVKIDSGHAIFEVIAGNGFKVRVTLPKAKLMLIDSGVFRIDVNADGGARVAVNEGRALLNDQAFTLLKRGQQADIKGGRATVAKLDRKSQDDFDDWSRSRGKDLAKQTARIKDNALRTSLINSFARGGWGMYSSFGLWVFDPGFGDFCFLPFGDGWYSPYGYAYGNCMCRWRMPRIIYSSPPGGGVVGGGTVGGAPGPQLTPLVRQGDRGVVPPFQRIGGSQGTGAGGRMITDPGSAGNNRGGGARGGGTVYTPPIMAPPTPPMAEPPRKKGDN